MLVPGGGAPTPENASSWLVRDEGEDEEGEGEGLREGEGDGDGDGRVRAGQLKFKLQRIVSNMRFVPYYTVQDELMEVYPAFPPTPA